jgi:hypothetical protein
MRTRRFIIAIGVGVIAWRVTDVARAAACTWEATYPPAIGRHTFLMATATDRRVTAAIDSAWEAFFRPRPVPAQVMTIDDAAGYQSESIRAGLRASGGAAVFVRYGVSSGCGPFAASDGDFDSVGVGGLYVGYPRPSDRWIDGMPTFDIIRAAATYPLPQRVTAPGKHGFPEAGDTTPSMSAQELFTMYGALWSESVVVHDTSVEPRIRGWLRSHPDASHKRPARAVVNGLLGSMMNALVAQQPIPFGGTFLVTMVAPGIDSLVRFARTTPATPAWRGDFVSDSVTGISVAFVPRTFRVDLTTGEFVDRLEGPNYYPCATIRIDIELPIIAGDSIWQGETYPTGLLDCAPPGSALARLTRPEVMRTFADEPSTMVFRRHRDGRVTFSTSARRGRSTGLVIRGERISTKTGY